MGEKIIVTIDKDLEDLIPEYMEMTTADLAKLRAALDARDYDTVMRVGHSLKGSGGGYGFDGITDIGGKLEQLAKTGAHEELVRWTGELGSYLERVEMVFE